MTSDTLVLLGLVGLGLGLIAIWLVVSRRNAVREAAPKPDAMKPLGREAERLASASSEAIEELVNQKLSGIPGLADTRVDFGTAADGSLEIWIGWERYASVDEIPDARIRDAVREAVSAYNR
ncbi:MAG TPA: hypothetical protein VLL77_13235 [Anaerolineales bacterium]|nr:hypothetical protein [Anaerolineales bacterium]